MDTIGRFAALLSYDGFAFHGFQRQKDLPTVELALEEALNLLDKKGRRVKVTGAGRTDRGVHALGQVVHFDISWPHGPTALRKALEANLPSSIGIYEVVPVDFAFHARRSALWRKYAYFIWKGDCRLPHLGRYVWWNRRGWDMDLAKKFLTMIEGFHDFGAFCRKADRPSDARRTIMEAGIEEKGPLLKISVTGRSFLTNMVRIIVGTMDEIATGRKSLEEICRLLDGGSRGEAGPTAPAEGLFLWEVRYDPMPFGCEEYNTVTGNFIL